MTIGFRHIQRSIAILAPAALAGGLVWHATAAGLVFTPDGVAYLEAARSFAAAGALWVRTECGRSHSWMTALAPFYSIALGLGIKGGWEPFAWARVLNALLAAISAGVLSEGVLLLSESPIAAFLAGAGAATLPDALMSERSMLSESLAIALTLAGWLMLHAALAKGLRRLVWMSAILLGLAAVTRFDTLLLAVPGAVCIWLAMRRKQTVAAFVALWAVPSVVLAVLNRIFAGGASPRTFAVHFPPFGQWEEAAKTTATWTGGELPGIAAIVLVGGALAAIAVAVFLTRRTGTLLAAGFLFTYLATLAAARCFFDITIDLGEHRHLLPAFYFAILAFSAILPRAALIPVLCVFPLVHFPAAIHPLPVRARYNANHPYWNTSETLAAADDLAMRGVCVYSNGPNVVYRRSDIPGKWLPRRVEWFTARPEPWCENTLKESAAGSGSAFVFFNALLDPESSIVSQPALVRCLGRVKQIRLRDGIILLPAP